MEEFIKCTHDDRPTVPGICVRCGARYHYCENCRTGESICQDCQTQELQGRYQILLHPPLIDLATIEELDREWEDAKRAAGS